MDSYTTQSPLALPLLWWASAIGLALASSAAVLQNVSATLPASPSLERSRLLHLHVQTLKLNPDAGKRQQYEMRGPTRLHVV